MKKISRVAFMLMAATMALSTVGCNVGGGGGGSSDKTVVYVNARDCGYGTDWIKDAEAEFERRYEGKEYEAGKMGVDLEIEYTKSQNLSSMNSSGDVIYIGTQGYAARDLAANNWLLDLTEVVNEKYDTRNGQPISIKEKIDPIYLNVLSNKKDKVYALPGQASGYGLSYDKTLFDRMNFYIADPVSNGTNTADNIKEYSAFGTTVGFIKNSKAKKSCGADGVYGTYDDGLPTALTELIVLSAYINSTGTVVPYTMTGAQPEYANYFMRALSESLAGPEEVRALYDFQGEIEYVEEFLNEPLMSGINYVKKPKTNKVTLTAENAGEQYKLTRTAARYYANAFMDIIYNQHWMSGDSTMSTVSHIDAQGRFLCSGENGIPTTAMLIEGAYWYTEAVQNDKMEEYTRLTGNAERDVRWMPLPVTYDKPILKPEDKQMRAMVNSANTDFIVINAREKNEGVLNAAKDFIKMVYSDEWLSYYSGSTGSLRAAMNYEISEEDNAKLSIFHNSVLEASHDQNTAWIYESTENEGYLNNMKAFREMFSWPKVPNPYSGGVFVALQDGHHAQAIFESNCWTADAWKF